MTIRFLHKDPALAPRLSSDRAARAERPANEAGFSYNAAPGEQIYPETVPEFVFWQCREAALLALETWAQMDQPLAHWQDGILALALEHDHDIGLEAHYDRSALNFFRWDTGDGWFFTGASTDAVAHEAGHAILDAIRPELWDSLYPEVAAFHEAFADCMALLVSLFDPQVCDRLIADAPSADLALDSANFLEQLAESVALEFNAGFGARHPASLPRRARNQFKWNVPTNFSPIATPGFVSREPHSFGQIFVGCFYDLIDKLFRAAPTRDAAALTQAAATAGQLLASAVRSAPEDIRFFRAVGRAMVLADDSLNGGTHRALIGQAFAGHDIALGSSVLLAPIMALNGPPPRSPGSGPSSRRLNPDTRSDMCKRVGVSRRTRISMDKLSIGKRIVSKASYVREVSLGKLSRRLRGTVARAAESVLLGGDAKHCLVLGGLPNPLATKDEVLAFVEELLDNGLLALGGAEPQQQVTPTHRVRRSGKKKVLSRIRYACTAPACTARRMHGTLLPARRRR